MQPDIPMVGSAMLWRTISVLSFLVAWAGTLAMAYYRGRRDQARKDGVALDEDGWSPPVEPGRVAPGPGTPYRMKPSSLDKIIMR